MNAPQLLDLTGLDCPLPVLKTKKFLATMTPGDSVKIITTDPASVQDFQEFCQKTGNILLSQDVIGNIITSVIKRRSDN